MRCRTWMRKCLWSVWAGEWWPNAVNLHTYEWRSPRRNNTFGPDPERHFQRPTGATAVHRAGLRWIWGHHFHLPDIQHVPAHIASWRYLQLQLLPVLREGVVFGRYPKWVSERKGDGMVGRPLLRWRDSFDLSSSCSCRYRRRRHRVDLARTAARKHKRGFERHIYAHPE